MITMTAQNRIIDYTQKNCWSLIGKKFYNQQLLYQKDLPIPPFFCLTSLFYQDIIKQHQATIKKIISNINFDLMESIQAGSNSIKTFFRNLDLGAEREKKIKRHFSKFFSSNDLVSVRASMIGKSEADSEDSADNPFAGMSESFLYVRPEQIIEKIKLCWASGFSPQVMLFRIKQNMSLWDFSVAVGIQKMISGEKSFVMFTCDPKKSAQDIIIIAGYGTGEGVVQEKIPVDHYFINYHTREISSRIANKTSQLVFNQKKGSGITRQDVAREKQTPACLSQEQLGQLHDYGRKIEAILKYPQDIEGTITSEGKVYFLQSRPIAIDFKRIKIWTNTNITESYPGVSSTLTYSFARYLYRMFFYDGYRMLGYSPHLLHDHFEMLDKMVGYLGGRIYYNLNSFYQLHSLSAIFPLFRPYWEETMMGFLSSYHVEKPNSEKIKKWLFRLRGYLNFFYLYLTQENKIKKFSHWWQLLITPLRGKSFEQTDLVELETLFFHVWKEVSNHWGITIINDTFLPLGFGFVQKCLKKQIDIKDDPNLLNDLLCGEDNLLSGDIMFQSIQLSEEVRQDPSLLDLFLNLPSKKIWSLIDQEKVNPPLCQLIKKYIHEFGDRGLQELKIEQPNIRHQPWLLLDMIKGYIKSGITVEEVKAKERQTRKNAEIRLQQALKFKPLSSWLIHRLLNFTRRLIKNREQTRYFRSELVGFSKNIFKEIGRQFVEKGVLKNEDDYYHLSQAELFGYIDGTGVTENLQALADIRRNEYAEHQKHETHVQITTLGTVRENEIYQLTEEQLSGSFDANTQILRGIGSCSGKVKGVARVVLDPNNCGEISRDMILIARETDPGWLFLMLNSKGIIVERGSMLSHTAITGRKFGIPTIVAVPNATQLIKEGFQLEMDATHGIIKILNQ